MRQRVATSGPPLSAPSGPPARSSARERIVPDEIVASRADPRRFRQGLSGWARPAAGAGSDVRHPSLLLRSNRRRTRRGRPLTCGDVVHAVGRNTLLRTSNRPGRRRAVRGQRFVGAARAGRTVRR
ncbi:hypothetical protein NOCARDAX2BIS_210112 [Nocardioides sp. AX2bis]|nr:hypothetical protein NOCARDAX2BIS_210112 [Nocardioides sp. AX2bis]